MRRNKGISMISLVIIVVVTVILIGIATTAGYKYITEGDRVKAEAVASVVSEAAYRRQNDLASGVAIAYYEGYSFKVDDGNNQERYSKMTGLPSTDLIDGDGNETSDFIPDCLQEKGAKWFLVDAESASALGVLEAERFLTRNISYILEDEKDKEYTLVLADYMSGKGYLVDMPASYIKDSIRTEGGCLNSPTGNHNFKIIATCTTPALCIYCKAEDPDNPALGHDFAPPTCTASGVCRRCKAIDPDNGPLGHLFISNEDINSVSLQEEMAARECRLYKNTESEEAWITDALKHWHECIRCGEKSNEGEHKKGYVSVDGTYHFNMCSICGWQSVKTKHIFVYLSVTDITHLKKCNICDYQEEHTDSGWLASHPDYHYRICDETDKCYDDTLIINGIETEILFKEAHYDHNNDLYCDVCGRSLDMDPPEAFGSSSEYYGKVIDTTTNSIKVEAFTEDKGTGIQYYQFGILNPINGQIDWGELVYPTDSSSPVQQTFKDLKSNTEYTIYVKATDKSGNATAPYKIPDTKTDVFPNFNGLTNIPNHYVKGPIYAGIAPIETLDTNLTIKYSLDDGNTWQSIHITELSTAVITLTKETEKILVKFVDDATVPNESGVWEYVIEKIDLTPPTVKMEAAVGDNNESLARKHTIKITLEDEKSGLAPDTEVRYAWSTDNKVVPTQFEKIYTQNYEDVSRVSFEINTPEEVSGKYYLWILEGVKDKVGNPTTKAVCSEIYFNVDDVDVTVSNIKMLNLSPAVEEEHLFVKTNGEVTISFETDKKLGEDAIVTLNDTKVTMQSTDGLTHVGKVKIVDSFAEGTLQLSISNIVSETGKISTKTFSNVDLTEGPVIYDKTLPEFEYISKQ